MRHIPRLGSNTRKYKTECFYLKKCFCKTKQTLKSYGFSDVFLVQFSEYKNNQYTLRQATIFSSPDPPHRSKLEQIVLPFFGPPSVGLVTGYWTECCSSWRVQKHIASIFVRVQNLLKDLKPRSLELPAIYCSFGDADKLLTSNKIIRIHPIICPCRSHHTHPSHTTK